MGQQLGSWVDCTGQQCEVAHTHAGKIDHHPHQVHDFLNVKQPREQEVRNNMHTDKDYHWFTIVSSFRVVVHCLGARAIRDNKHNVQVLS